MYTTADLDDAFVQLEQAAPTALPRRAAMTEPALVEVVDDGLPVGVDAEVLQLGGPQHPTPHRPAGLVAALAAVAVLGSGAFVLSRHTGDRSSTSAARSTSATPRESIYDHGFDGQAGSGGPTAHPSPTPTLAFRTVSIGPDVSVSPPAPLPEAQAVGVKVGPLSTKWVLRSAVVVGPSSLPRTLVAGRSYTITFRYYAAVGSKTGVGHVALPFSDSRCPADFRVRPGRAYTVECRVKPERGTDSIGFTVTAGLSNSSWQAGATVLLIAR